MKTLDEIKQAIAEITDTEMQKHIRSFLTALDEAQLNGRESQDVDQSMVARLNDTERSLDMANDYQGIICDLVLNFPSKEAVLYFNKTYPKLMVELWLRATQYSNGSQEILIDCQKGEIQFDISVKEKNSLDALFAAFIKNQADTVKLLLTKYPGVFDGNNAWIGAGRASCEMVQILIDAQEQGRIQFDVNAKTAQGFDILSVAVIHKNQADTVGFLLETFPGKFDGNNAWVSAGHESCECEMVQLLIDAQEQGKIQFDVNAKTAQSNDILSVAVFNRQADTVGFLLGAFPGKFDGNNAWISAGHESCEMVKLLIDAQEQGKIQFDVSIKNAQGFDILSVAVVNKQADTVRLLLNEYPGKLDLKRAKQLLSKTKDNDLCQKAIEDAERLAHEKANEIAAQLLEEDKEKQSQGTAPSRKSRKKAAQRKKREQANAVDSQGHEAGGGGSSQSAGSEALAWAGPIRSVYEAGGGGSSQSAGLEALAWERPLIAKVVGSDRTDEGTTSTEENSLAADKQKEYLADQQVILQQASEKDYLSCKIQNFMVVHTYKLPDNLTDEELAKVFDGVEICCPLSFAPFNMPVLNALGEEYDLYKIMEWFDRGGRTDPKTGEELSNLKLSPNKAKAKIMNKGIDDYTQRQRAQQEAEASAGVGIESPPMPAVG